MWLTVGGINATEIDDDVARRVLDIYPEENLSERPIFSAAFSGGTVEYSELREECEKILVPWQMFLLSSENLTTELGRIETERQSKLSSKLLTKRRGLGNITSKRIIDRLIRQQNFLKKSFQFPPNRFCGSIRGIRTQNAASLVISHFGIERSVMWRPTQTKERALDYLIKMIESEHINVSRGVLTNKIVPTWRVVPGDVYKNTSGFVIKDESVPFIFLPSELNPDEVGGRQIYTLLYLVVAIGLGQYDYSLDESFKVKMLSSQHTERRIHEIVSEILMPASELDQLRRDTVTPAMRDRLSAKYKVSPLAFVTSLRMRGIITRTEYEALKPPPYVSRRDATRAKIKTPRVSTSVRKFCGQMSFDAINSGIRTKGLTRVQAQHLIFGAANKKGFKTYCKELGL